MANKKICVVINNRANYSSIKSALIEIGKHPKLKLYIVATASCLLDRFGSAIDVIKKDGFSVHSTINMIVEGETPQTMAKSTGLGLLELSTVLGDIKPDIVLVVGDRFESLSTAIAASYMNIPLAHTMGGEISGSIDGNIRHAVTKLSHIHFAATEKSALCIKKMGEDERIVFTVGCPRIDLAKKVIKEYKQFTKSEINEIFSGSGPRIDLNKPYLLVCQHPVTTEYEESRFQIDQTLGALNSLKMQTLMFWPNVDAGSDEISRGIRIFRERHKPDYIHFIKNLPPELFMKLMVRCSCMVGNSSSAIREGSFLGTPAVNVGTRQMGRERAKNVIDTDYDKKEILAAVLKQSKHKRYPCSYIYGDGLAGKRIANILSKCKVKIQKKPAY